MRQPPDRQGQPSLSEREVDTSNATLNVLFPASRQKTWMVSGQNPVRPTPRRTSTSTESPPRPHLRPSVNQVTVLPSPAPSDDFSPISNRTRQPGREEPHVQHQQNSASTSNVNFLEPDLNRFQVEDQEAHSPVVATGRGLDPQSASNEELNNRTANREGFSNNPAEVQVVAVPTEESAIMRAPQINLLQSPTPEPILSPHFEATTALPTPSVQPTHPLPLLRTVEQQRLQIQDSAQQLASLEGQSHSVYQVQASNWARQENVSSHTTSHTQNPATNVNEDPNPTNTENRRRTKVPTMPSLKSRVALINAFVESAGDETNLPSDIERARFRLLKDACEKEDSFYVATHQLFCAWDVHSGRLLYLNDNSTSVRFPPQNILSSAFTHLGNLLRPNVHITLAYRVWFSDFPSPLSGLLRTSEPYRRTMQDVVTFLTRLAEDWTQLSSDCYARKYPPLVEELVGRLGLTSPILQQIVFTATRRNLGVEDDGVGRKMEEIFRKDQQEYEALSARMNTDRPPTAQEIQERKRRLVGGYSSLFSQALQRRRSSESQTRLVASPALTHIRLQVQGPQDTTLNSNIPPRQNIQTEQRQQLRGPLSNAQPTSASASASPDISAMNLNSPSLGTSNAFRRASRPSSISQSRSTHTNTPSPNLPHNPTMPINTPILRTNSGQVQLDRPAQGPQAASHAPVVLSDLQGPPLQQQLAQRQQIAMQLQQIEQELQHIKARYGGFNPNQLPVALYHRQQDLLQQKASWQQAQTQLGQMIQSFLHHNPQYQYPPSHGNEPLTAQAQPPQTFHAQWTQGSQTHHLTHSPQFSPNPRHEPGHVVQNQAFPGQAQSGQALHNEPNAQNTSNIRHQDGMSASTQAHDPAPVQASYNPSILGPANASQTISPQVPQNHTHPSPLVEYQFLVYNNTPVLERTIIPPVEYHHPLHGAHPEVTAIHQAHLRSPNLVPNDKISAEIPLNHPSRRFYQIVKGFVFPPMKILATRPVTDITFSVPRLQRQLIGLPRLVERPGQPEIREFVSGTLQYRMRCVKKRSATEENCTEADWVVSDTTWPDSIVFKVHTGKHAQQVEIRRKIQHGKDLPVDLTAYVRRISPDENIRVTLSIPGRRTCLKEASYFFAIEVVEIAAHDQLMIDCQRHQRPAQNTLEALRKSLSGPELNDDEIALVSNEVTLDLTDPFSSRIFDIPVRGNECLHRECFDLETFLLSRTSKPNRKNQPCMIDVWKCPLCNRDARPASLHVDEFLVKVRNELKDRNALKVKAIIINKEGQWKPKPPPPANNGKRRNDDSDSDDENREQRKRRHKSASAKPATVVIDLSDDE